MGLMGLHVDDVEVDDDLLMGWNELSEGDTGQAQ